MGVYCLYERINMLSRFCLLLAGQQIYDVFCTMGVHKEITKQIASLVSI